MALDLFAGIPVTEYAAALKWYERLLGSPPAFFPNDTEAVWELAERRSVYIERLPERAGHAMHTIFVDDLDTRLAQIAERPAVRAADLAADAGRDKLPFKRDVRKLKELGLTESLETGYRLSPRGRALVEGLGRRSDRC